MLFVFEQKTAYEMRISDWSSDVCSSDLTSFRALLGLSGTPGAAPRLIVWPEGALGYFLEDGYPPQYYWESTPAFVRMRIAARLGPKDVLLTGGDGLLFDSADKLTMATHSIFAVDGHGRLRGRYDRAHPGTGRRAR